MTDSQLCETNDSGEPVKFYRKLGKYQYLHSIGKGSYSVVALVKDSNENLYAAKIVSRQQLIQYNLFGRFEQEVRLVQSFNHPNIIKIHDLIYETDNIVVVMEYCSHGDLFNYIDRHGPFEENLTRSIFRGVLEAVQYIHDHHVCHRDIKLENILIGEDFVPKLIDFGLCHLFDEYNAQKRLLSTPCGSLLYVPPEIVENKPYDGRYSDMWSLGIVLYGMSTASLPWSQITPAGVMQQIQEGYIYIPSDVAPPIQQIINLLLDKNPENRPLPNVVLNLPWMQEGDMGIFVKGSSLEKTKSRIRFAQSQNDALNALLPQSFADVSRKLIIVKPNVERTTGNAKRTQSLSNYNNYTNPFTLPNIVRKVPPTRRLTHH